MKTSSDEKVSRSEVFWDYFGSEIGRVWTKMSLVMRLMYALTLVIFIMSVCATFCKLLWLDLLGIVVSSLVAFISGAIILRDFDIGATITVAHWRAINYSEAVEGDDE